MTDSRGLRAKAAFLLVGMANTGLSTLVFILLDRLLNPDGTNPIAADGALLLAFLVCTPLAYLAQRTFVFRSPGRPALREFARFAMVASGMYVVNLVALPLLVMAFNHLHDGAFHLGELRLTNSLVAQVIVTGVVAASSWFSHSRFSFAR